MSEFIPEIAHMVCIDKYGLIGASNDLVWHIPEEFQYFKDTTKNSIVVMGSNTFRSLESKPLKDRINIVITSSKDIKGSDSLYVRSNVDSALKLAQDLALRDQVNIFIIGGAAIYNQTISYASKFYITGIDYNFEKDIEDPKDLIYYDYDAVLDLEGLEVESSFKMKTTSPYSITAYVFKVVKDD